MNHKKRSSLVHRPLLPLCHHVMAAHPHITDPVFECLRSNNTIEMMIRVLFTYRASAISRQWGISFPRYVLFLSWSSGGDRLMHRKI